MYKKIAVALALVLGAGAAEARANAEIQQAKVTVQAQQQVKVNAQIQQQVRQSVLNLNNALAHGDAVGFVNLLHESEIQKAGGREQAIAAMTETVNALQAQNVSLQVTKLELPTQFATAGNKMFVVVPYTLQITTQGQTVVARIYAVGVSTDQGKSWTFVGGRENESEVREMLPDLPASLQLPAIELGGQAQ